MVQYSTTQCSTTQYCTVKYSKYRHILLRSLHYRFHQFYSLANAINSASKPTTTPMPNQLEQVIDTMQQSRAQCRIYTDI